MQLSEVGFTWSAFCLAVWGKDLASMQRSFVGFESSLKKRKVFKTSP